MKALLLTAIILLSTSAARAGVEKDNDKGLDVDKVENVAGTAEASTTAARAGAEKDNDKDLYADDVEDVAGTTNTGLGLMTWLMVLVVGAAGGFAGGMLAVARSRSHKGAEDEWEHEERQAPRREVHRPAPVAVPHTEPHKKPEPKKPEVKKTEVKKPEVKPVTPVGEDDEPVVTPPVRDIDEELIETVVTGDEPVAPVPEKPEQPSVARKFANFTIPQAGLIIVRPKFISDDYTDQLFEIMLDEKAGTGTYTVAPGRMGDIVRNLGTLEKFVEKFEFNPESDRIEIVSNGTLRNMGGYWQVIDLLKIKMI